MVDEGERKKFVGGNLVCEGERGEDFQDARIDEDATEEKAEGEIGSTMVEQCGKGHGHFWRSMGRRAPRHAS